MASPTAKFERITGPRLSQPTRSPHAEGLVYAYIGRRGRTYVDRPFSSATPAHQVMENRVVAALRVSNPDAKVHTLARLLSLEPEQVEATLDRLMEIGRVESRPGNGFRLRTASDAR